MADAGSDLTIAKTLSRTSYEVAIHFFVSGVSSAIHVRSAAAMTERHDHRSANELL